MSGWRDQKAKALSSVHATFEVPAVYLVHGGAAPIPQTVRVHLKNVTSTLLRMSDWTNGASNMIETDRVIFSQTQLGGKMPAKDGYVVIGPTEIYRIGPCEPEREGYVAAEVVKLMANDCATLMAAQNVALPEWSGIA